MQKERNTYGIHPSQEDAACYDCPKLFRTLVNSYYTCMNCDMTLCKDCVKKGFILILPTTVTTVIRGIVYSIVSLIDITFLPTVIACVEPMILLAKIRKYILLANKIYLLIKNHHNTMIFLIVSLFVFVFSTSSISCDASVSFAPYLQDSAISYIKEICFSLIVYSFVTISVLIVGIILLASNNKTTTTTTTTTTVDTQDPINPDECPHPMHCRHQLSGIGWKELPGNKCSKGFTVIEPGIKGDRGTACNRCGKIWCPNPGCECKKNKK